MVSVLGVSRDKAAVLRATVSVLLVFVSAVYNADSTCDAVNVTVPCPTSVIALLPLPSLLMVATASSLDE